jgi:hypothetical protein
MSLNTGAPALVGRASSREPSQSGCGVIFVSSFNSAMPTAIGRWLCKTYAWHRHAPRFTDPKASISGTSAVTNGRVRLIERKGTCTAPLIWPPKSGMSYLVTNDDEGKPDWNMYWALRIAVRHQPDHTQARCKVAAFEAFETDAELQGDTLEIARRWSAAAGYNDLTA